MTKHKERVTAAGFLIVALVVIDQLIKLWAKNALMAVGSIEVIPRLFYLTYVENYGAAFGILQGKARFLSVVVSLVIGTALVLLFSGKIKERFLVWSVSLVLTGGIGNLIDRVRLGYVVDYLDFSALFGFPVFNFADCCVVVGTFLILIYVLFLDKSHLSGEVPPDKASEKEA